MYRKLLAITLSTLLLASCGVFKGTTKKTAVAPVEEDDEAELAVVAGGESNPAQLNGEWLLWTIGGKKVGGDERPYLHFSVGEGRVYGNMGCNTVNGDYEALKDGSLRITGLIQTMMSCHNMRYESAIGRALDNARFYRVAKQGHEYYLDLADASHKTLMTLRRHNMEFLNGAWTPTRIGERDNDDSELRLVIDIAERRVHGRTGCNIMNGALLIDPDKASSVQFLDLTSTRTACERSQQAAETALLVALESVEHAKRRKGGSVVMTDKDGNTVLVLKRLDLKKK